MSAIALWRQSNPSRMVWKVMWPCFHQLDKPTSSKLLEPTRNQWFDRLIVDLISWLRVKTPTQINPITNISPCASYSWPILWLPHFVFFWGGSKLFLLSRIWWKRYWIQEIIIWLIKKFFKHQFCSAATVIIEELWSFLSINHTSRALYIRPAFLGRLRING